MKLNRQQMSIIRKQIGIAPVPEPVAQTDLVGKFGDQTFYVDDEGLYVFEPVVPPSGQGDGLIAIQLAEVKPAESGDEVELRPVTPRISGMSAEIR